MKKKVVGIVIVLALIAAGYLATTIMDSETPVAIAAKKTYSATVYVAGMGGHFAKADVTIDPNNAKQPVLVHNLDRVNIGTKKTHPTHDARLDNRDSNVLFWSTYKRDPDGKIHVGKSDLKTGKVIKDIALTPDPRAPGTKGPIYCASGQDKKHYMPVFMGSEGYIDIIDKKSMELKRRVFVTDLGYKPGTYKFVHGINSPDMKKFLVVINQAGPDGKGNGKVDFILVKMKPLLKGKWKVIAKNTLTGEPNVTLTFRQYFSNDGKFIYQSAADRMWVLNGENLKLVDEKMMIEDGSQVHDVWPTPDNKYALMTVRLSATGCDDEGKEVPGKDITDGVLYVYDAGTKKILDGPQSICLGCHRNIGLGMKNAVLCGIDGTWSN